MKQFKYISLAIIFLSVFSVNAQQKIEKVSQSIKANNDVVLNLNTSHTNIVIDTWNKNEISVEAYIESKELSNEKLQDVLENWDVNVKGSGNNISISSFGGTGKSYTISYDYYNTNEYSLKALEELQFIIEDIPELPELSELTELSELPELPEIPELPELSEGVHKFNFDFEAYKKDGEKYLEKWSQVYEKECGIEYKNKMKAWAKEYSKTDFDEYSKEIEEWTKKYGEKFGKDYDIKMDDWSKKFDDKWVKKMEAWGEKYGAEFEAKLEKREKALEDGLKKNEKQNHLRKKELEKREEARNKRSKHLKRKLKSTKSGKIIKTIKIKMPKKAKLKVNVRHGELKIASVIHNLKADLSHSTLIATSIDGNSTSINASYTPVIVTNWNLGELKLNYVENAELNLVKHLLLNSNSSNIIISEITGNAIINGSFGDIEIDKISESFKNLNLTLENCDAFITLPKSEFNLQYQGTHSKFQHPDKTTKNYISTFSSGNLNSDKTIVVNADYCKIVMQ